MRLLFKPNVEKLNRKGNVSGLIEALGYRKDAAVRVAAAEALGRMYDPLAIQPLTAATRDESPEVRVSAVRALGWITNVHIVAPPTVATWDDVSPLSTAVFKALVGGLEHQRLDLRTASARALGDLGSQRAAAALIEALNDWEMREAAAQALASIGAPAIDSLVAFLVPALVDQEGQYLIAASAAAEILGDIGDTRAIPELVAVLEKTDSPTTRGALVAAKALDQLGWRPDRSQAAATYWIAKGQPGRCIDIGSSAIGPLVHTLKGKDAGLRRQAVDILMAIGNRLAVDSLLKFASDSTSPARSRIDAIDAVAGLGSTSSVELLFEIASDPTETTDVSRAATYALARLGDSRAEEPLLAVFSDKSEPDEARLRAGRALAQLARSRRLSEQ